MPLGKHLHSPKLKRTIFVMNEKTSMAVAWPKQCRIELTSCSPVLFGYVTEMHVHCTLYYIVHEKRNRKDPTE